MLNSAIAHHSRASPACEVRSGPAASAVRLRRTVPTTLPCCAACRIAVAEQVSVPDVSRYQAWKGGFEALVGTGDNPGILKSPGKRPDKKIVGPPIILRTSPLAPGEVEPLAKVADAEAAVQPYIAAKVGSLLQAAVTSSWLRSCLARCADVMQ